LSGSGSSSTAQQAIAEALRNGEMTSILLGPSAINHPQFAAIRSLAAQIAKETNSRLGYLPEGANSAGACLAGVLPHRGAGGDNAAKSGLNCLEMLDTSLKAYVLFGVEPELDCAAANSLQILQQADFTVAMSAFRSARLEAVCDVMLPISAFAETSGTFVNAEGRWQSFNGVAVPPGETRPGWKVLRVLGNLLECAGFDYVSSEQVRDELQTLTKSVQPDNRMSTGKIPALHGQSSTWMRIADVSIYSCDSLVRRAIPLQATNDAAKAVARLNRMMANQLSVTESDRVSLSMGSGQLVLPVVIDEKVPNYSVLVHAGLPETASLGQRMAPIIINKAS
jgi:NADH-quinone oxidoreductase subunit G